MILRKFILTKTNLKYLHIILKHLKNSIVEEYLHILQKNEIFVRYQAFEDFKSSKEI